MWQRFSAHRGRCIQVLTVHSKLYRLSMATYMFIIIKWMFYLVDMDLIVSFLWNSPFLLDQASAHVLEAQSPYQSITARDNDRVSYTRQQISAVVNKACSTCSL